MKGGPIGSREREDYFAFFGKEVRPYQELALLLGPLIHSDSSLKTIRIPDPNKEREAYVVSRLTVQNAVGRLPTKQRLVICMLFVYPYGDDRENDIGNAAWWMGISPKEIKRLRGEALDRLVKIIYSD